MATSIRKKPDPEANRRKAREWRARMRAQGLRPVQLWIPDTRSAAFLAEALRQSRAAANSEHEREINAWIEAVSEDIWVE
jgi:Protein  of unknown function (DUF3018)